jgi:hypothetical protein
MMNANSFPMMKDVLFFFITITFHFFSPVFEIYLFEKYYSLSTDLYNFL